MVKVSIPMIADRLDHWVLNSLHSIADCDFPKKDYEVIVVYDYSEPWTKKLVTKFARNIGLRLKLHRSEAGRGPGYARNRAIGLCRANYLAVTEPDCVVPENWLSLIYHTLRNSERDVAVIVGNVRIPKSNFLGDCISMLGYPGGANIGFDKMHRVTSEGYTKQITNSNCGMKKRVILKVGGYDNHPLKIEDKVLSLKLYAAGYKVKYIPELAVWHPPRKSLPKFAKWMFDKGKVAQAFFEDHPDYKTEMISTRLWSSRNVIKTTGVSKKLPVVGFLLFTGLGLQATGYLYELLRYRKSRAFKS